MLPLVIFVYTAGITSIYGTIMDAVYTSLLETRLTGPHTRLEGPYNSITSCSVYCAYQQGGCVAVNHNKELDTCEIVWDSDESIIVTSNKTWNAYYRKKSGMKLNARAEQSSSAWGARAAYAIDDKYLLDKATFRCSHTAAHTTNWFLIDFKSNYPIKHFAIWNWDDNEFFEKLRDLVITVSEFREDIDDIVNLCTTYDGPPASVNDNPVLLSCSQIMVGRFLKILQNSTSVNYLSLCELDFM